MRSAAPLVVQFQMPARPAVRCSLYDMLGDIGAGEVISCWSGFLDVLDLMLPLCCQQINKAGEASLTFRQGCAVDVYVLYELY